LASQGMTVSREFLSAESNPKHGHADYDPATSMSPGNGSHTTVRPWFAAAI